MLPTILVAHGALAVAESVGALLAPPELAADMAPPRD